MSLNLKTLLSTTATVACSWGGGDDGAKAESPPGMKLYVFPRSGFLNIDKWALQAGAAPGKNPDIPVGFFLIRHELPVGHHREQRQGHYRPELLGPLATTSSGEQQQEPRRRNRCAVGEGRVQDCPTSITSSSDTCTSTMQATSPSSRTRPSSLSATRSSTRSGQVGVCRPLHPRRPFPAPLAGSARTCWCRK